MLKSIKAALLLCMGMAIVSASSLTAAKAADPIAYGVQERGYKFGHLLSTTAEVTTQYGVPVIELLALQNSIGPGPNHTLAVAAAVMDFTKADPNGVLLDSISFDYHKLKRGLIFKDTTDPIVRIEYADAFNKTNIQYKTLPLQTRYQLTSPQVLPSLSVIRRFAVVAKAKVFTLIDDYAYLEVFAMKYKVYGQPKDQSISIQTHTITDSGLSDRLLNF